MIPTQENYVRSAVILKVTDADTVVCRVDMGYRIYAEQALRLNRINAPELSTSAGKLAKNYLLTRIQVGSPVLVKTFKNPADKYGRWLAEVYHEGVCLNDLLVEQGHAVYQTY